MNRPSCPIVGAGGRCPDLSHALREIPEFGYRVLRVIYNRTQQPALIVTAYFDRTMKGKL